MQTLPFLIHHFIQKLSRIGSTFLKHVKILTGVMFLFLLGILSFGQQNPKNLWTTLGVRHGQ